jgi:hypothetical protein
MGVCLCVRACLCECARAQDAVVSLRLHALRMYPSSPASAPTPLHPRPAPMPSPLPNTRVRRDHSADLNGKRVALVGTGASAVQIIPTIAPTVGALTVFQRSAAWVVPKPDFPTGPVQRWVLRHVPLAQRLQRLYTYLFREWLGLAFFKFPHLLRRVRDPRSSHVTRLPQRAVLFVWVVHTAHCAV